MSWMITVRPTTEALNDWRWQASRADEETWLQGSLEDTFTTSASALEDAKSTIRAHERRLLLIENQVVTETYEPTPEELA